MLSGNIKEKILQITSSQNPKIKLAQKLWDRRQREKTQLFLIEGYRELKRATLSPIQFEMVFTCPELFLGENENELINGFISKNIPVYQCSQKIFHSLSYRDRPDGLIAVAGQFHLGLEKLEETITKNPFLVIAESIEKPGNLGTILRSADAVGIDSLIVCDRCTDIHNPNVVRASVGTLFTVPVIETDSAALLRYLKQKNILIVAATPSAKTEYTQADLSGPIAILVGTEQYGLSDFWMENADLQVRIPMLGIADSLNVAMAATLLMYESLRQRSC